MKQLCTANAYSDRKDRTCQGYLDTPANLDTDIIINVKTSSTNARPNNLSLVYLFLSLYISLLLFGHFFYTLSQKKKNVQIIKRKYKMTNIDTRETDYSV